MVKVELRCLTKKFDDGTIAVDELDVKFDNRELSVIVGPSGSGKTTLLRLIAGLEDPTKGEILINNREVTNLPPHKRNVHMVFQNYALYPHMRVKENLGFSLRIQGYDKTIINRRVGAIAKLLHIEKQLEKRPGTLSGGEKQRVALGRAIIQKRDVILLDEPMSNLDAKLRVEMRTELKKIQRDLDLTMIFVTHDQTEAMALADKLAVIKKGKIQQFAKPLDLYNNPSNTFVSKFLGTPSINLIDIELVKRNHGFELVSNDFRIPIIQTDEQKKTLLNSELSKLTLGIRPEDISFSTSKKSVDTKGRITLIENLGNVSHYHINLSEKEVIVAGLPGLREKNKKIGLKFNLSKVILFERDCGKLLCRGFSRGLRTK